MNLKIYSTKSDNANLQCMKYIMTTEILKVMLSNELKDGVDQIIMRHGFTSTLAVVTLYKI